MAKFLDIALDIGEKNPETGGIQATQYFEDYLHEIIDAIGGESEDLVVIDPSPNLSIAGLQAKVAGFEKKLDEVDQANQGLLPLRSEVSGLEKKLTEIDQENQVIPLRSKVSVIEKTLNDLASLHNETPQVRTLISKLNNDIANQEGLIDSITGDVGYLRQLLNKLRTDDVKDFFLEMSKDKIPGHTAVGKFGEAPSGVQTSPTDIWSRANATPTQQIWLAPTAARVHTISSDSAADVSGGTGTTSVEVFYLVDWDTAEKSEVLAGDINAGIAMAEAAVMINRMIASPQSTSVGPGPNIGTIIATAATDGTITSVILPGEGQTEQAIYGLPSGYTAYIDRWSGGIDKAQGAAASADFQVRYNPNPDVQTLAFIRKRHSSVQSTGTSKFENRYKHDNKLVGPGIIKIQAIASAADVDGYSEFDLTLVKDGY